MTAENTIQNDQPKGVTSKLKRLGAGLLTALVAVTGMITLPSAAQAAEGDSLPRLTSTTTTTVPIGGWGAGNDAEMTITRTADTSAWDGVSPVKFRVDVTVEPLATWGPPDVFDDGSHPWVQMTVKERLGQSWIGDWENVNFNVLCHHEDDYDDCPQLFATPAPDGTNDFYVSWYWWVELEQSIAMSYEYSAIPDLEGIEDPSEFETGTATCAWGLSSMYVAQRMAPTADAQAMANPFPQECAAISVPILAEPVEPDFIPSTECDVEGVVVLPETEGVVYTESREGDIVTVTATPAQGYSFPEDVITEWTYDVSAEECPDEPIEVTPIAPELVKSNECDVESTVTIPEVEGVVYEQSREGDVITVTATAADGYVIADGAETSWSFDVKAEACPEPKEPETPLVPVLGSSLVPVLGSSLGSSTSSGSSGSDTPGTPETPAQPTQPGEQPATGPVGSPDAKADAQQAKAAQQNQPAQQAQEAQQQRTLAQTGASVLGVLALALALVAAGVILLRRGRA